MIMLLIAGRIKGLLLGLKKPLNILLTLVFTLTSWVYGWMLANIINKSRTGEIGNFTPEKIINYSVCLIMGLVLVRTILPRYNPQKQLIPKFYPITIFQNYLISVVSDFLQSLFLYITLFIVICCFYLKDFNLLFLQVGCSAFVSAHLTRRLIQYGIDYRIKNKGYVLLIFSFLVLFSVFYYYINFNQYLIAFSIFIPIYLFFIGYLIERTIIESRIKEISGGSRKNNFYLKLIIHNPKARLILIIGFILKFSFLIIGLIGYLKNGNRFSDGQPIYWLFASPLILFTYVFNNIWGYWQSVWFNYELRLGGHKEIINFSLKLLAIPLSLDIVITVPLLLLSGHQYIFILLFYFLSALFLVCFSAIWSVLFPIKVSSLFQMRGSSSVVSTFASMIAVGLLLVLKLNYWFYVLIPLYLTTSYIAFKYSPDLYKEKKYSLFKKMFNK